VHHAVHITRLVSGAVVLDQTVGLKDVGADLVAPGVLPEALLLGRLRLLPFADRLVVESGAQHLHGAVPVAVLGTLVLTGDHDSGGDVGDPHRRIGHVHVLAALAAGPEGVDTQIALLDFDLDPVVEIGERRHRREAGVAPMLGVERRHADQPMDAGLDPEPAVSVIPPDLEGRALDPGLVAGLAIENLDRQAASFGPAHVHLEQHPGPVLGIGSPGSRIARDDGIFRIVLSGEQLAEFEVGHPRLRPRKVLPEVGLHVLAFSRPLDERRDLFHGPVELAEAIQLGLERSATARKLLAALRLRPDVRVAQLAVEFADFPGGGIFVKETPG